MSNSISEAKSWQATEAVAKEVGDTQLISEIRDRAAETAEAIGLPSPDKDAAAVVPEPISETNKQRFLQWLRLLLYQLMLQIRQVEALWVRMLLLAY